tara:strand:- start:187 stop:357 length:171 start_codon:yes stop_codon:yes gene_type:complete
MRKQMKLRRQESATERQAARAERTEEAQLLELDRINGKGRGAKKERARLTKRIASR